MHLVSRSCNCVRSALFSVSNFCMHVFKYCSCCVLSNLVKESLVPSDSSTCGACCMCGVDVVCVIGEVYADGTVHVGCSEVVVCAGVSDVVVRAGDWEVVVRAGVSDVVVCAGDWEVVVCAVVSDVVVRAGDWEVVVCAGVSDVVVRAGDCEVVVCAVVSDVVVCADTACRNSFHRCCNWRVTVIFLCRLASVWQYY